MKKLKSPFGLSLISLADQSIISAGNFLTQILIARLLAPTKYGLFALAYGIILSINSLHNAMISYRFTIVIAINKNYDLNSQITIAISLTVILSIIFFVPVSIVSWYLNFPVLGISAIFAQLCWQLQELLRRFFIAQLKYFQAILSDIVSYLGQVSILLYFKVNGISITPVHAFKIIACTSMIAFGVQIFQSKYSWHSVKLKELFEWFLKAWELGKWILLSNFGGVLTFQAFLWTLVIFYDSVSVANLQLIANLMGVTHIVFFGIGSLIVPIISKQIAKGNDYSGIIYRISIYGAFIVFSYLFILLLFPDFIINVIYGNNYSYLVNPLRLYSIVYMVNYFGVILGEIFVGLNESRKVAQSQILASITSFIVCLPLIIYFGVMGAIWGQLLFHSIRVAFLVWQFLIKNDLVLD